MVITIPDSFRRMPRWWADADGRAWLEELPALVARQCSRWDLDCDGAPMHGSNALVVPVRRGAEPFVLRLAPPGDDVATEAAALRVWDGRGTVRLFAVDRDARAMLLERLDGSRSLTSTPLPEAVDVIAELVGELAVAAPSWAPPTTAIAAGQAADLAAEWAARDRPTPRRQLDTAIALAAERAEAPALRTAADGDLHCGQVLPARDGRWVVVDPVLLRGDPEYDFARVLWDRLDEVADDAAVVGLFDRFVSATGVPRDRARSWVVLRSMSYLLWGLAHGLTRDPPKCRRLLDIFC